MLFEYEKYAYKTENGKVYFNTGIKAEALGETISPWDEVKEEDGMLRLFTYRLVRES